MHGRIFVIDTYKGIQYRGGLYELPWEPWEMREWIPGCDYVTETEDFEEDCLWLADIYELQNNSGFVLYEDENFGERKLFQIELEPFTRALQQNKQKRIEEVKAEIFKPNPDMWRIKHCAWDSMFWFVWEGHFEPEMGLLEHLLWLKKKKKDTKILITESYDYHS